MFLCCFFSSEIDEDLTDLREEKKQSLSGFSKDGRAVVLLVLWEYFVILPLDWLSNAASSTFLQDVFKEARTHEHLDAKSDMETQFRSRKLPLTRKIYAFYHAPIVKFWSNTVCNNSQMLYHCLVSLSFFALKTSFYMSSVWIFTC